MLMAMYLYNERKVKMKKIISMIFALTLSCAVLAACGDKTEKNDSPKESSSLSETENSETPDDSGEETAEGMTLAQLYTESLENKDFRAEMITSSDFMDDVTTIVEVCGGDYHMSLGDGDERAEVYVIGGVMYMLNHADMSYIKEENPDERYMTIDTHSYTMGIEDGYMFISSAETADGLICETYHAPDLLTGELPSANEDGEATVYKYYFEQGKTTPLRIEMTAYGMSQTTTFNGFSFDVTSIELPDLSEWTDNSESVYDDAPAEFE